MKSYREAISKAAELAPALDKPGEFLRWAEDYCELLSFIYDKSYDIVTEDLIEAAKDEQGWLDEEEDEEDE